MYRWEISGTVCSGMNMLLLNVYVVMCHLDVIAARFLTFHQMYSYERRLETFADWPFREDCQCTPELMAKAGFVHCPSENEPDVACCFYCLKELEGWEPEDIPWSEHAKRSPDCGFLQMKSFHKLTAIDFFRLEHGRIRNYVRKMAHMKIAHFRDEMENTSKNLRILFDIL
ncbi:hypothetical protein QTP70_018848 [Hemibagrus guttatus]|uniref:Uncharacterized protein n=1 Tax=Hemibagrus guttatus TaxID=175788 RepID=A0AAE0QE52_9TELE|nr:hypothetical protein QTP70_018848 [Hemibagrus guttatus]